MDRRPSLRARSLVATLLAALLASTVQPVAAQAVSTLPTATAPDAAYDPANWLFRGSDFPTDPSWTWGTLPNGVRFAVRRAGAPPGLVSVRVRVAAGALMEEDDEKGYAHLLEHLAFRGSETLSDADLRRLWQRLGVSFGSDSNAETTPTHTVYKLDVPAAAGKLPEAVGVLAGMVRAPAITDAAVALERQVVIAERNEVGAASRRIGQLWQEHVFQGTRLASRPVIGTPETLGAATSERMTRFHRRWYRPERTVVVMTGDMDPAQMTALIVRSFGDWRATGPKPPEPAPGRPDRRGKVGAVAVEPTLPPAVDYAVVRPYTPRIDTIANTEGLYLDYLAALVINRRLERRARGGGTFLQASVSQDVRAQLVDVTTVTITPLGNDWASALVDVRGVLADAVATPPSVADIEREAADIETSLLRELDNAQNENSTDLADDIVTAVDRNEVNSSPQIAVDIFRRVRAAATPEKVHAATRRLFAGDATRVVVSTPQAGAGDEARIAALMAQPAVAPANVRLSDRAVSINDLPTPGPAGTVVSQAEIAQLKLRRYTLSNGVQVVAFDDDAEPGRVRVNLRFGEGRRGLSPTTPGLLWTGDYALVASGIGTLDDNALEQLMTGRRLQMKFGVDDDAFELSAETTPADLADQLRLLTAKLASPRWDERPVARLRAAMLVGFDARRSSPGAVLQDQLESLLYAGDERFAAPDREDIERLTGASFRQFWEPRLREGPVEVQLFGDLGSVDVSAIIAQTLGTLPPRMDGPVTGVGARFRLAPASGSPVIARHNGDPSQTAGITRWATGGGYAGSRDRLVLEVIGEIMRDRLFQRLRSDNGATYTPSVVNRWPLAVEDGGALFAAVLIDRAALPQFYAVSDQIAQELRTTQLSAEDLERIATPLAQSIQRVTASNAFFMAELEGLSREPRRIDALRTLLTGLQTLTPAEVQAVARKYLTPERRWRAAVIHDSATITADGTVSVPAGG